jgi:1,4-dihydroxy-6-naphthoate synthase
MSAPIPIRLGHSPDPDDAFMFWALAEGALDPGPFRFEHVLRDIETLNQWAREGRLEITAISVHAYAYVHERYALLPHGASIGDNYGPKIVAARPYGLDDLQGLRIAVPGTLTTAYLAARLLLGEFEVVVTDFDRIFGALREGRADAGLLIHEGQLTFAREGFHQVVDLGAWWHGQTGLPLPLGANAVRRDLGEEVMVRLSTLLRASIACGLAHRDQALPYAMRFGRGLDAALADQFVGMYVNDFTLDYGARGRQAVETLLARAAAAGLVPPVALTWVAS